MTRAERFAEYRPLLFSIAYRMLGSVMDAEDVVQDAFLRWQQAAAAEVESPKAYLSTIVTRLCLDHLRSARVQREQYVGPWLPEPLVVEQEPDVADTAALHESLSMAFLVLLESLTPLERAVFLLHDVFGYDFAEVARVVGKSEANCRQLARRARSYVEARRPRFEPSRAEQDRLTAQFLRACNTGDLPGLVATLADDITLWTDGGGKVQAARNPIHGADAVARFILGALRKAPPGLDFRPAPVNGQPGVVSYVDGRPFGVVLFDIARGRIQGLRFVVNPDKLQHLAAPEDEPPAAAPQPPETAPA
ncbi:MAG TPA: RNA polymerase sigma-70 factor [Chloroflexota bacterium]|jgi:RNA polymerase sigma-70 factor (ECF subfamily)